MLSVTRIAAVTIVAVHSMVPPDLVRQSPIAESVGRMLCTRLFIRRPAGSPSEHADALTSPCTSSAARWSRRPLGGTLTPRPVRHCVTCDWSAYATSRSARQDRSRFIVDRLLDARSVEIAFLARTDRRAVEQRRSGPHVEPPRVGRSRTVGPGLVRRQRLSDPRRRRDHRPAARTTRVLDRAGSHLPQRWTSRVSDAQDTGVRSRAGGWFPRVTRTPSRSSRAACPRRSALA